MFGDVLKKYLKINMLATQSTPLYGIFATMQCFACIRFGVDFGTVVIAFFCPQFSNPASTEAVFMKDDKILKFSLKSYPRIRRKKAKTKNTIV